MSFCGRLAAVIVLRVEVIDDERPIAVDLDDRFAFGARVVVHPLRQFRERTGWQFTSSRVVVLVTRANLERSLNDDDDFVGRMPGLRWGPAPPVLPGCAGRGARRRSIQAWTLSIRLKMPDGYRVAPHVEALHFHRTFRAFPNGKRRAEVPARCSTRRRKQIMKRVIVVFAGRSR
jgi:hypothetical protein